MNILDHVLRSGSDDNEPMGNDNDSSNDRVSGNSPFQERSEVTNI